MDGANFGATSIVDADLRGAKLAKGNFAAANFAGADLSGADLSNATLPGATLKGTKLAGATFCDTVMPNGAVRNPTGSCRPAERTWSARPSRDWMPCPPRRRSRFRGAAARTRRWRCGRCMRSWGSSRWPC